MTTVSADHGREGVATEAIVRRPLALLFGASVGGSVWSALMQIGATPFYLRVLGVEGYGLIGFYTAVQAILQVLDLGGTLTVSREVARLSATGRPQELRDLVRTYEVLYWLAALLVGGGLAAGSSSLVRAWFREATLDPHDLRRAVMLMGALWAAQWLIGFYSAVLSGFERFVELNLFKALLATMLHGGGVLWLLWVSPSFPALFAFQTIAATAGLGIVLGMKARALPHAARAARADLSLLRAQGRLAGSLAAMTICGTLLAQSDKIIVARLLPLHELGFYALASLVATGLFIAVVPLFQTLLPRLSALAAESPVAVREVYRGALEAVSVLAMAPAAVLFFFGEEVIALWTRNPEAARSSAAVAALLVIGSALNAVMTPAYALQIAMGYTRFALGVAACQLLCFIPLAVVLASRYGAVGAAAAWPVIHAGYVLIGLPFTQKRLLKEGAGDWIRHLVPPAASAFLLAGLVSRFAPEGASTAVRALFLGVTSMLVLLAAVVSAPRVRVSVLHYVRRIAHA